MTAPGAWKVPEFLTVQMTEAIVMKVEARDPETHALSTSARRRIEGRNFGFAALAAGPGRQTMTLGGSIGWKS